MNFVITALFKKYPFITHQPTSGPLSIGAASVGLIVVFKPAMIGQSATPRLPTKLDQLDSKPYSPPAIDAS